MFAYFIPEILILLSIMAHIQKGIISGLFYYKENDINEHVLKKRYGEVKYEEDKVLTENI